MAAQLAPGKWIFHSSDKFDEYMKALGVGLATRVIVTKLKPDIEISIKEGIWTMKTMSTFKNTESIFKLDEKFQDTTPDGRQVEVLCTVQGNKLIRKEKGEIDTTQIREFSQDQFKLTMEAKGVTCTRVYNRSSQ